MPDKIAVLAGKHAAAGVCALVKSMPRAASASMFGVLVCGCPPNTPTQSLRSSMAINRTSGLSCARLGVVKTKCSDY